MSSSAFQHTDTQAREVRQARWDFSGQTVLVTGAAHGQARAHALSFASAGANVAICDICANIGSVSYPMGTVDELEDTAEQCRAAGANVISRVCDVRSERQVEAFVNATVEAFGGIDVAVANAGVGGITEAVDLTEQEWDEMLDTNLKGVFLTFKHVARRMIDGGGGGRLIATGSVNSFTGVPGCTHYVAAKHGVAGLCKSLAIELAPHRIRVNYVCPTAVNTHMIEIVTGPRVPENFGERLVATAGSWNLLEEGAPPLEPFEVSEAMMWLASDSSNYVTGAALAVDAGFLTK